MQNSLGKVTARGWWWTAAVVVLLPFAISRNLSASDPLEAAGSAVPLARLFDLILLALALFLAHAGGQYLLRVLRLSDGSVTDAALAAALGLGVWACTALVIGLLGLYRPPVLVATAIVAVVLLRRDLVAPLTVLPRVLRAGGLPSTAAGLVAILALVSLLALLGALTPPHHWDPLAYHLAAPRAFLRTGWIAPVPGMEWSNLPLTTELLYGVGLAFGSPVFGQLLHLAFAGLTAAALWDLAARHFDRTTAWFALATFLGTPMVAVWARVADIDLALGCFITLAIAAALRAHDAQVAPWIVLRWLALAGVFAGLALGSKYQAAGAVVPLGALVVADVWLSSRRLTRGNQVRATLRAAAAFGGVAVLVASPWYLKNWLLLGNPVWPLVFGGRQFSPLALELTNYYLREMVLSPRTLTGYLLLPVRMYQRGDFEQRFVILSPLLPLLPILFVLPRRCWWRWETAYLLGPSAGFGFGWVFGFQEQRYLLAICGPLSLGVALVLREGWSRRGWRRLVLPGLYGSAIVTLVLTGLHVGADRPLKVLLGRESVDTYLRKSFAYGASYRATSFLHDRAAPGQETLFLNEAQLFYLPEDLRVRPDHLNVNLITLTEAHPDPVKAVASLRAAGIDYLLVNEANIRFWRRFDGEGRLGRSRAELDRITPLLEEIYRDGTRERPAIVIYRVP